MLGGLRQMLQRIRRVPAVAVAPPLPTLQDELEIAGLSVDSWIAQQRVSPSFYVELDDEHAATLASRFPDHVAATLAAADRFLAHEFDFLGSGPFVPVDPDRQSTARGYRPIDWRLDPVRKLRFPGGVPYREWDLYAMRPRNADIKLPWELARCQHLPTVGQAYRLTGDPRYAREVVDEILDFAAANPVGVGIHWTCTMDVALRAANWALALGMVRRSNAIDTPAWLSLVASLFAHGAFVENNLENKYEVTSNHFASNVVGLFFLSAMFAGLPSGTRWRTLSRQWLEEEMQKQVLDDGADYESSIPYHRLMLEFFLGSARLAALTGEPLSAPFLKRLQQMVTFFAATTRPDGHMPVVGDADDGRLHILNRLGGAEPQDGRHVFAPAALMFHRPDWLALAGETNLWEAAWWGLALPADGVAGGVRVEPLTHFPRAGLTALRTDRVFLLITNGVVGTAGFGNHKHNDQLAFEYHRDGVPMFVDPGSYVYTSDADSRNRFRGTASHNTVMLDDVEQNEFKPEWLFRMFEQAHPEHVAVRESASTLEYVGRHSGYRRLSEGVVHVRRFALDRATSVLTLVDRFEGRGRHRARWHFHCAPGATVEAAPGIVTVSAGPINVQLRVPPTLDVSVYEAWYSPSYGVRVACRAFDLTAVIEIQHHAEYAFEILG